MMVIAFTALFSSLALAADEPIWPENSPEARVYKALLPRDLVLDCKALTDTLHEPAATLNKIVEHTTMPPWVPMRAASCMLDALLPESLPYVESWLQNPEHTGLAKMVKRRLDHLPPTAAIPLKKAAITGPHQRLFSAPSP